MTHPNPAFAWQDEPAMRAFTAERGFGLLSVSADGKPATALIPFVWLDSEHIGFHVAKGNTVRPWLEGATAILNVLGPDAYISPDWYELPDKVPTWNYAAVEIHGSIEAMTAEELTEQLDRLSYIFETRLAPKKPWTRDKMTTGRFDAMTKAIAGFRLKVSRIDGVIKLNQNKPETARSNVAEALAARGEKKLSAMMLETRSK